MSLSYGQAFLMNYKSLGHDLGAGRRDRKSVNMH